MIAAAYQKLQEHPLITGWIGSATTLSAAGVSIMQEVTGWVQLFTTLLGAVVGVLTLLITWRKWRQPVDRSKEE